MRLMLIAATVSPLVFSAPVFAAGAIAVDSSLGDTAEQAGYGVGSGATIESASEDALKICTAYGNAACVTALTFEKGECGAYAVSQDYFGIGHGITMALAEQRAIEACDDNCKIITSACDP